MDVDMDSPPPRAGSSAPHIASGKTTGPVVCITTAALELLADGLRPFIATAVRTALGEDLYEYYLPAEDANIYALLKYIRSKWLGVFSDTQLEPLSTTIDRLADAAYAARRTINPLPIQTARETVRDTQSVLIAIRRPALAAQVAELETSVDSASRSKQTSSKHSMPQSTVGYESLPPFSQAHSHLIVPRRQQVQPDWHRELVMHQLPRMEPDENLPHCVANSRRTPVPVGDEPPLAPGYKMPVALDGSNIAWRHGASKRFSFRGVAEALAYFAQRGHPSVVFLPEARMRNPPQPGNGLPEGELEAFGALQSLQGGPQLVLTPEKDYDDCYLTSFARAYQAVIVSNDNFTDQVYQAEAEGGAAANAWRRWLAGCRLSFTFHGHAFVPNPAFSFERAQHVARELCSEPS